MPDAVPDSVLLASVDVARTALLEITDAATIGAPAGHVVEGERVLSMLFECTLPGYPGWHWTVTMSRIDDESEPSVLEAELMPGEKALLAPDWVPWSERLADYQAQQEAARAEAASGAEDAEAGDDDEIDDDIDDDDIDDEDDEADELEALHGGDIDGVDIDEDDIDDETDAETDDESR